MSIARLESSAVSTREVAQLFPLPISLFELYMLTDARPGYPMMCDLELHFDGVIERAAFDAAIRFAIGRHPLFQSIIVEGDKKRLFWELSDREPEVDWAPEGVPLGAKYDAFADLRTEIGLRVWVRQGETSAKVLVQFHHACADGLGGIAFADDLLVGYAAACCTSTDADIAPPPPLELERLRLRDNYGPDLRTRVRKGIDWWITARESARFVVQSPRPLPNGEVAATGTQQSEIGFLSQPLSEEVTAGLRRAAAQAKATINDVLLRDLFVAMREWCSAQNEPAGKRNLRILMPQNLRLDFHRSMPAGNTMSFAFLTHKATECDKPNRLLARIRDETDVIRRMRSSLIFIGSLVAAHRAGTFDWVKNTSYCFSTSVLTNLGDPTRRFATKFARTDDGLRVGNLVFRGITGGPPLRPLTRAAFAVFKSARRMTISLKCDAASYSSLDTRRLLDKYVEQLGQTADAAIAASVVSRRPR